MLRSIEGIIYQQMGPQSTSSCMLFFADDHTNVKQHSFLNDDVPMEGVDDTAVFQQSSMEEEPNENEVEMSEGLEFKLDLSPGKGEQKDDGELISYNMGCLC